MNPNSGLLEPSVVFLYLSKICALAYGTNSSWMPYLYSHLLQCAQVLDKLSPDLYQSDLSLLVVQTEKLLREVFISPERLTKYAAEKKQKLTLSKQQRLFLDIFCQLVNETLGHLCRDPSSTAEYIDLEPTKVTGYYQKLVLHQHFKTESVPRDTGKCPQILLAEGYRLATSGPETMPTFCYQDTPNRKIPVKTFGYPAPDRSEDKDAFVSLLSEASRAMDYQDSPSTSTTAHSQRTDLLAIACSSVFENDYLSSFDRQPQSAPSSTAQASTGINEECLTRQDSESRLSDTIHSLETFIDANSIPVSQPNSQNAQVFGEASTRCFVTSTDARPQSVPESIHVEAQDLDQGNPVPPSDQQQPMLTGQLLAENLEPDTQSSTEEQFTATILQGMKENPTNHFDEPSAGTAETVNHDCFEGDKMHTEESSPNQGSDDEMKEIERSLSDRITQHMEEQPALDPALTFRGETPAQPQSSLLNAALQSYSRFEGDEMLTDRIIKDMDKTFNSMMKRSRPAENTTAQQDLQRCYEQIDGALDRMKQPETLCQLTNIFSAFSQISRFANNSHGIFPKENICHAPNQFHMTEAACKNLHNSIFACTKKLEVISSKAGDLEKLYEDSLKKDYGLDANHVAVIVFKGLMFTSLLPNILFGLTCVFHDLKNALAIFIHPELSLNRSCFASRDLPLLEGLQTLENSLGRLIAGLEVALSPHMPNTSKPLETLGDLMMTLFKEMENNESLS